MEAIEEKMGAPDFWDDKEAAQKTMSEVSRLKGAINPVKEISSRIEDLEALVELAAEENCKGSAAEAITEAESITTELDRLELQTLLSGKFDRENAFLTIHAGAGGTEAL